MIPEGRPISEICEGSPYCSCRPRRVKGGTLLSQYKKGKRTAETRAANAEYIRGYRAGLAAGRKTNGTA